MEQMPEFVFWVQLLGSIAVMIIWVITMVRDHKKERHLRFMRKLREFLN